MTRKVSPRRRQSHSLRMETLEDRRLLAFAAFESTLLRDNNGIPGEIIADNVVAPGEVFFLQITAQEFDPGRFGLQAIGVDVAWDASLLDVIEEDFDLSSVLTEHLPINQSGTLDQDAGTVSGLGGSSNRVLQLGRPIGNAIAETLATIRMQAGEQVGTAGLNLQFGEEKIVTAPYALLGPRHLDLDSEQIHIVAEQSPESAAQPTGESESGESETAEANVISESTEALVEESTETTLESDPTDEQPESADPVSEPETLMVTESVEAADASMNVAVLVDSEPSVELNVLSVATPEVTLEQETLVDASPAADSFAAAEPVSVSEEASATSNDSVPAAENTNAVDQIMSFDVNQDGVFDFADFGLMNVQASIAASVSDFPETESTEQVVDNSSEDSHEEASQTTLYPKTCLAFPESNDVAANEAWLDAFAAAWVADTQERLRRRQEAANS